MFEEYDVQMPFLEMGFGEENEEFSDDEAELLQDEADFLMSQQQGNWLDGYLDAMEEWEDEADD